MSTHQSEYEIIGHDTQMVEITLDSEETVIAEAGMMIYLEQNTEFSTKIGDGSARVMGSIFNLGKRVLTGESIFLTHFTDTEKVSRRRGYSAPIPGSIIPLHFNEIVGEE